MAEDFLHLVEEEARLLRELLELERAKLAYARATGPALAECLRRMRDGE